MHLMNLIIKILKIINLNSFNLPLNNKNKNYNILYLDNLMC